MKPLSGLDASFLALETASSPMHVSAVCIATPSGDGPAPTFEQFRQLVADRLHLAPPWRRRMVEVPFGLHHPLWIEDPDFDLDFHVRRAALPAPGGRTELAQFAADFHATPLDRKRPLWQLAVVEGLEGGRVAIIGKTHHAAIDGVSGAEILVNLLDLSPEIQHHQPDTEWEAESVPSDVELVAYALRSLAGQPMAALRTTLRTAEVALNLINRNRQLDVEPPPSPFDAPRTSLNTPITPHRRFVMVDISLGDVKTVKNAFGCTVNDVVVALCSGALRRHFQARHETIDADLVAMVPISVRTENEKGAMGNKVSGMLTSLATTIDDPIERLEAIVAGTRQGKEQDKAIGAEFLTDWTEFMAPAVAGLAARLYCTLWAADTMRPPFNVVISNVPGPGIPLYSCGAQLEAMYPMGPIIDGMALNITIFSYRTSIHFGLVACRESVPDIDGMGEHLQDSLDELLKAAEERNSGLCLREDRLADLAPSALAPE